MGMGNWREACKYMGGLASEGISAPLKKLFYIKRDIKNHTKIFSSLKTPKKVWEKYFT
jgi:hypothetical protein